MQDTGQTSRVLQKWGIAGKAGFQVLPDLLLKNQIALGLDSTDIVVLINLTMHWWYEETLPFPRTTTIATRMGCGVRTVQRSFSKMQKLGLIQKKKGERTFSVKNPDTEREEIIDFDAAYYDLSGLVLKLGELAKNDKDFKIRNSEYKEKEPNNSSGKKITTRKQDTILNEDTPF